MKKQKKTKSSRKSKATEPELPDLVTVMAKFLERIEAVEKKMDQVLSRIGTLSFEVRSAGSHAPQQNQPQQNNAPKERVMYRAVCADCYKNCEVPFKPGPDRPIYCKECWAIRKVGHKPQDPEMRSQGPQQPRPITTIPREVDAKSVLTPLTKKQAKKLKDKAKKAARKKKK